MNEKTEKLLIVVDMVNGFVKEGNMADPYIGHIIEASIGIIKEMEATGNQVVFIKDTHKTNCREFKRYPIHCIEGTKEAEVIEELKPFEKVSYQKNSTNAFNSKKFKNDIKKLKQLKEIIITGCCTDICVMNLGLSLQTYFDESNQNIDIIIPVDAVETYNSPTHNREIMNEMAQTIMNQAGIKLVKTYKGETYGK